MKKIFFFQFFKFCFPKKKIKVIKFSSENKLDDQLLIDTHETLEVLDLSERQLFSVNYFNFENLKKLVLPNYDETPWFSIKQIIMNTSNILEIESNQIVFDVFDHIETLEEKVLASLIKSNNLKKRIRVSGNDCDRILSFFSFSVEALFLQDNVSSCLKNIDTEETWKVNNLILDYPEEDFDDLIDKILPKFSIKEEIIINCKINNYNPDKFNKMQKFRFNKGYFKEIDLSYQNLTEIPQHLNKYIPYFHNINLSGNYFSDISFVKYLQKTKILNLTGNKVTEDQLNSLLSLPHEIQVDLCSIDENPICKIENLEITTRINALSWISQFSFLTSLSLENQKLEQIPSMFTNFTHLRTLSLSRNKIKTVFIESIPEKLDKLDLSENPKLRYLDKEIFLKNMKGELNLVISKKNNIEEFEIPFNTKKLPYYLEFLPLTKLTIYDYPLREWNLKKKTICSVFFKLKELYICPQDHYFWSTINQCENLEKLVLFQNALTNKNAKYFQHIKKLKYLQVEGSDHFDNVRLLIDGSVVHSSLEELHLKKTKITYVSEKIWRFLPFLKRVSFSYSPELGALGLKGSKFEVLNLDGCSSFSELKGFFGNQLSYLNITGTKLILDIDIINEENHLSIVKNYFECGFSHGVSSNSYYLTKVTLLGDPYAG